MEAIFKVLTGGKEGDHLETGRQRRTSICIAINTLYSGTRITEGILWKRMTGTYKKP